MQMTAYDPNVGVVKANPNRIRLELKNGAVFQIEQTNAGITISTGTGFSIMPVTSGVLHLRQLFTESVHAST